MLPGTCCQSSNHFYAIDVHFLASFAWVSFAPSSGTHFWQTIQPLKAPNDSQCWVSSLFSVVEK